MKNNYCDKLLNNELLYNYGTRPALSSVTSPVAKLPLLTKVLSLFINTGLIKLLGNPVSKFTTSYNWAVRQKLKWYHPILRTPTCSPRASSPPPWASPGARAPRRSRLRRSSPSRQSGRSREERAEIRGHPHQLQRWAEGGQQLAGLDKPWENRNIQSWELLDQLALTLVKWLKTPTRSL